MIDKGKVSFKNMSLDSPPDTLIPLLMNIMRKYYVSWLPLFGGI